MVKIFKKLIPPSLTYKKLGLLGLALFLFCLLVFFIFRVYVIHAFEEVLQQQNNNTIFYDLEGRPFHVIQGKEDRKYTPLHKISRNLQKAVLAIEDARFFYHYGFDPIRLGGVTLRLFKPGAKLQGASTITQQLVKISLLSPERTFTRKFKELFMAIALESKYSKAEILEFYLNAVYLGHRNYGVENASLNYYHKSASELSLAESALIAGLIKKPEGYSPYADTSKTRKRQLLVLKQMKKYGWITKQEYQEARQERIQIKRSKASSLSMAPFYTSHVLLQLKKRFKPSQIYGGGLRVYTTLLREEQKQMEGAIAKRLQKPKSFQEAAGLSMDPRTGFVGALVGGVDFKASEFNRATQAKRQPGSSIKPILYTAALRSGIRIHDIFQDEPRKYPGSLIAEEASYYEPVNYTNKYLGPITFGSALQNSNNVVSVQILSKIGISSFARMAESFGIEIPKERGLCLALGCGEVTLMEMVRAYGTFANDGVIQKPVFIVKVADERGRILWEYKPTAGKRILTSSQAYQANRMLQNVIQHGTGKAARLEEEDAGGKTGTTDGYRDAWFIGFTANKVAGFWVGNDDNSPMEREVGGGTPARLWKQFMVGIGPATNQQSFALNPDYEDFLICNGSGLLANSWCLDTSWLPLQGYSAPTEHCAVHEVAPVERFICKDSKKIASDFCPTERIASQRYLAGSEPVEYCDTHDAYSGEGEYPSPMVLTDPNATPVLVGPAKEEPTEESKIVNSP